MSKRQTPVGAIRMKCLNCQGDRPSMVRRCQDVDCSLHPFRLGTNPGRKGIGGRKPAKVANGDPEQGSCVENPNSSSVVAENVLPNDREPVLSVEPPLESAKGNSYAATRARSMRSGNS